MDALSKERTGTDLIAKLASSLSTKSLSDIAKRKKAERAGKAVFLLLDCSGSMGEYCEPSRPKITALRELVSSLREQGLTFTQVVFPGHGWGAEITTNIPNPDGGTPLHAALDVANVEDARHIVLISDGMPDNEQNVTDLAQVIKKKGVKIDVFYVGPYPHPGEKFLRSLASMTGGQMQTTSLKGSSMLALSNKVRHSLLLDAPR